MNPLAMAIALAVSLSLFIWSASRRFRLLKIGSAENRFDQQGARFGRMLRIAFFQKKLPKYKFMGYIHVAIFWGFLILLINTIILWGRGFDRDFNLLILGHNPLGTFYHFVKDITTVVVFVAAGFALVNRLFIKPQRLTRSFEAVLILLIIMAMMIADLFYWGSCLLEQEPFAFSPREPMASLFASVMSGLDGGTAAAIGSVGFWTHSILVLVFLNLLPYGKQFHVITAIPNVFFSNMEAPGRLPRDTNIEKALADDDEDEDEDEDETDEDEEEFGVSEIQHFTWKDMLDMYSCTECGRCADNCPAAKTGKPLNPKNLLLSLRDHLYEREKELLSDKIESLSLVPDIIDPQAVWSCTTCRACEEECPVMNSYVDKIVRLRRDLVEGRGEPPAELGTALRGIETNANPWNLSSMDRGDWAEGLDVPEYDSSECDYLFFVGCMSSFDERARKISRSLASLFKTAGVRFGILGESEPCCGETARRAGSESNFLMMVEENIEEFKELGVKKIVTGCPHCFNTFKTEYPDFGGQFEVIHHTTLLTRLLTEGKLDPKEAIDMPIVYHDACYLGRYNGIYLPSREIIERIPGTKIVEAAKNRERSMCCGAGGARYFMEETGERINDLRVGELLESGAGAIASACPYCMTMLQDGLKSKDMFDQKGQLDVAEILAISCGLESRKYLRENS
jgi:Fe-S oxidoreductase